VLDQGAPQTDGQSGDLCFPFEEHKNSVQHHIIIVGHQSINSKPFYQHKPK